MDFYLCDTVTIDQGIGEVGLNDSTTVSPTETTTYTITAEGPGGTAADSAMVVMASPEDIDYGFDADEQQGGEGLVGETVRILNGNVVEYRSDLGFSSPNRLGLHQLQQLVEFCPILFASFVLLQCSQQHLLKKI